MKHIFLIIATFLTTTAVAQVDTTAFKKRWILEFSKKDDADSSNLTEKSKGNAIGAFNFSIEQIKWQNDTISALKNKIDKYCSQVIPVIEIRQKELAFWECDDERVYGEFFLDISNIDKKPRYLQERYRLIVNIRKLKSQLTQIKETINTITSRNPDVKEEVLRSTICERITDLMDNADAIITVIKKSDRKVLSEKQLLFYKSLVEEDFSHYVSYFE